VFVGIGPTADVTRYLGSVRRAVITDFGHSTIQTISGTTPASAPRSQDFWVASSGGTGTRTVAWHSVKGSWTVVVMNADGRPGIDVRADAGATMPALPWIAVGLLGAGGVSMIGGALLMGMAVRRANRVRTAGAEDPA
jgi:hypothetical protein